jgi:hypothetical protein
MSEKNIPVRIITHTKICIYFVDSQFQRINQFPVFIFSFALVFYLGRGIGS